MADPAELLVHEEPIFANGVAVGVVTSGMYGHRVQASLGMGYVTLEVPITTEVLRATQFEIGVAERRVSALAQLGPWYDPTHERTKS